MSDSNFSNTNRDMDFAGINVLNWPVNSDPNILDPGQVTDWTWYNKGTASATRYDNTKTIDFIMPASGGAGIYRNRGLYKAIPNPSNQWSFIAKFDVMLNSAYYNSVLETPVMGIGVRSSLNEVLLFCNNPWNYKYAVYSMSSGSSSRLFQTDNGYYSFENISYFKINNDGVQNNFYISRDGNEWMLMASLVLGAITDQISYGFFGATGDGTIISKISYIYSSRFIDGVL